jgi:hypothetical protein
MWWLGRTPFMASVSDPRRLAFITLPLAVVSNQCIATLGPAWKTEPFDQPNLRQHRRHKQTGGRVQIQDRECSQSGAARCRLN